MQTFTMQVGETLDFDIDFSAWLPDGDTITSTTAALDKVGELDITSVAVDTPIVKVWMCSDNAVDRTTYKITVTASTAGGRVKEVEFRLRIKEQ